jgi:lysophospholipase L1-like esterase
MDLRILAIGDCNTCGVDGAAPETQMVRQVASQLDAAGHNCLVQNLGRTMSTSREGLARIQGEAAPADLLLLNFGLVDAWVTSIPRIYISYYPDHALKKWARKLLKSLKRRLRGAWLRPWVPVGEVVPIEEYERNICRILDIAHANNPRVCCILWGTVAVPGDQPRSRNIARYNECLRSIADKRPRTTYLDSTSHIQEMPLVEAYLDHVHISHRAAQCIAEAVARVCRDDLLRQHPTGQKCAA